MPAEMHVERLYSFCDCRVRGDYPCMYLSSLISKSWVSRIDALLMWNVAPDLPTAAKTAPIWRTLPLLFVNNPRYYLA